MVAIWPLELRAAVSAISVWDSIPAALLPQPPHFDAPFHFLSSAGYLFQQSAKCFHAAKIILLPLIYNNEVIHLSGELAALKDVLPR